ncbi:type I-E CRISPR-associated protein Cse1/CasA [Nocardia sp. NPDC101769]|uniref:type I-E CRISPR-associated protein Cse1/CasA n=1 Tax=Nocardia sp. NPDC101769 TaxID=3364333 RepID=UPI0038105AAE
MNSGDLIRSVPLAPCRFDDGSVAMLPVADMLANSHRIVGVEVEVPTMLPALLRQLLLPITVHALGSPTTPEKWGHQFERGRFNSEERGHIEQYLAEYADRFDVLDTVRPFGQVADLRTEKGDTKGAALLVATAPSGNNVPLFAVRTEADRLRLPLDVAVRWMLHAHCWDPAAIKTGVVGDPKAKGGKTSGNPTGPLGQLGVVMPIGRTLYETLLLNTPIGVAKRLGVPQWARDPLGPQWEVRSPDGVLDLWTWQSRRIRLFVEHVDGEAVVERVIVAAGDRFAAGVPDWETHTAWRKDKPAKGSPATPLRPLRHVAGKAAWRGLDALLALESATSDSVQTSELLDQLAELEGAGAIEEGYPLLVETFGIVYGNQSAVIEDLVHDTISLPVAALRGSGRAYEAVVEAADQAERLVNAINRLSADLRRAVGTDPIPWDKGQRPGEQLLVTLDPVVRRLLAGVSADSGDEDKLSRGQLAWELMAYDAVFRCAEPLFALPSAAFIGRTVKSGSKEQRYSLGLAANSFRSTVNKILSRAAAERVRPDDEE